jgi:hypothetical protein
MKFEVEGKHVKTIPAKFEELGDLTPYILEWDKKRLSKDERDGLEIALRWKKVIEEMKDTHSGQLVAKMLEGDRPVSAAQVILRDKKRYYVARTKKNKEVRISESLYNALSPKSVIYRNF